MRKLVVFLLLFSSSLSLFGQEKYRDLSTENWQFHQEGKSEKYKANVPGTVHTDLLQNNLIPDPFLEDNEAKLQWIENENWVYETSFNITNKELNHQTIQLQFNGLDTYATVFLNETLLLEANNMFRIWNIEVKKQLRKGNNSLKIIFYSASRKGKELAQQLPYTLPEKERVFVRKAQYHFGWDWGPRLVTAGIYKKIQLHFSNHGYIENCHIQQKKLTKEQAHLLFKTKIWSNKKGNFIVQIENHKKEIRLEKGFNTLEFPYEIEQPKLWWCNGLGDPHLYHFTVQLYDKKKLLSEKKETIGLRNIEWVQEKDNSGKSFYLKLNGIPVFIKGANYIPPHSFLPEVSTENYTNLVVQAKNANMNMLRVWGGGVYADDAFYNACDANGILVWQDFMFACAMYPGDTAFLNNVKSEITDNIIRLQNHPSIAIWCGNNENDEGWHNWGWQKQFNYSKEEENQIWKDYEKLFHELIPATLNETLGENQYFYWPSSPSIGWGKKESLTQGDSHYWGVWWGKEPFEMYTQKVGRFMSEYGFQGMPPLSTFKKFTTNLNWENPSIKVHQKHPTGYETIDEYLVRDYKKPSSFDEYVYVSQLLQAEGMKTAIEAHRRAMPYCMGSLYWQFNDCWPVTSWSSIDFYGNWKAFHYQVKRSFERQLISFEEKNNIVDIFGINEDLSTFYGQLKIELIDFFGRVNWQYETSSFIHPNSSNILNSINLTTLPQLNPNHMFLKVTLDNSGQKKEGIYYFVKPKDLQLHQPDIRFEYLSNHQIKITSTTLIKNLYLEAEGIFFEDNFFDVLPNEPKIIQASKEIKDLKWYSLNTIQ